jgi:NADPH:quinone reductase-like Zn-dependent oxidoreductase
LSLLRNCHGVHGLNLLPLYGRKDLARRFEERLLPPLVSGEIAPVIHGEYPLDAAGARRAHEALHSRENIGKTVLTRA